MIYYLATAFAVVLVVEGLLCTLFHWNETYDGENDNASVAVT